jgi:hypothetical protein
MKPKTKKVIGWSLCATLTLAFIAVLAIPSGGCVTPSAQTRDISNLRVLSIVLFAYASDTGKYPERIEEILKKDYLDDPKALEDVVSRITYIRPKEITTEPTFVMLILPSEGGVTISYSNCNTEFIKTKKRKS